MSATEHQPDTPPRTARLDRALTRVSAAALRQGNQLALLCDGPETYADWLAAISRARRWVHLENYIFKSDSIGQRFAEALIERAQAGVTVRVLYDWFGCADVPRSFWRKMRQSGVDVRVVNPPHITAPVAAIYRDHRKLVTVDGVYGSVGGVCIADEWLARSPVTKLPYRDTAVRASGPVVADLDRAFAQVWQLNGSPLPAEEWRSPTAIEPAGALDARVIIQEPGRMRMLRMLQIVLAGVEQRFWIADAYFIAVPILREALSAAARDGVDVRILVPATNDLPWLGALSRYGYRPLLEAGVRIWEYAGLMMHAKTTIADGWWGRVGSTNLNVSGLEANWELDIVGEDYVFGAHMEAMYENDLSHAREIRLHGAKRLRARPSRPESSAEQLARRQPQVGNVSAEVAVVRIGAALQTASSATVQRHERALTIGGGLGLLALGLLVARFPRVLAWPLAAASVIAGGLSLVRAARHARPRVLTDQRVRLRKLNAQFRRFARQRPTRH